MLILPVPPVHPHFTPPSPTLLQSLSNASTTRQSFLENSFPSTYLVPSSSAIRAASTSDEKELDREEKTHEILEPKLSIPNTITKFLFDQSLGAAVNTLLFSLAFAGFNGADYKEAWVIAAEEFWPLMTAGWKLWPLVSVTNYAFVKSVEGRALVGSLAGMGWGIYVSLMRN
jgi:protein Mpv17